MNRAAFVVLTLFLIIGMLIGCNNTTRDGPSTTPTAQLTGMDQVDHLYPLFALARTELSICVDGMGGYHATEADLDTFSDALRTVLSEHPEAPQEQSAPSVSAGCPAPKIIDEAGTVYSRLVDQPSEHYLFVYFLSLEDYRAAFHGLYTVDGAEHVCSGDECMLATLGIYIPSTEGLEILQQAIIDALSWGANWMAEARS